MSGLKKVEKSSRSSALSCSLKLLTTGAGSGSLGASSAGAVSAGASAGALASS